MSPERSAAPQTFQLCRCKLAMGSSPEPKRWMLPPGSCSVSVPCLRRASSLKALRAAAGAPAGKVSAETVEVEDCGEFIVSQKAPEAWVWK